MVAQLAALPVCRVVVISVQHRDKSDESGQFLRIESLEDIADNPVSVLTWRSSRRHKGDQSHRIDNAVEPISYVDRAHFG
jgi:hypothetical protein|tara:strand:- start:687 stop:926 length:240 start_codon:yes stop_codon:yes gene_type:complete